MMRRWRITPLAVAISAVLGLSACAETELAVHTAKQISRAEFGGSARAPRSAGTYKVGSPYRVGEVWYYPKVDYTYRATGIASWYGPGFHGRRTANGEIYDQSALTAAHPTLPMPSIVRVTNLENGRSVKVRVNDRGPFKNGRIIDLSRRAADLLGFRAKGTAKVMVEIVEDESRRLTLAALSAEAAADAPDAVPLIPVSARALPAPDVLEADMFEEDMPTGGTTPGMFQTASAVPRAGAIASDGVFALDGAVSRGPVEPSEIYIQAGAFTRVDLAIRLRARLAKLGDVRVAAAEVDDRQYFRVRIGPLATVDEADHLLSLLLANGHTEARMVVE